MYCCKLMSERYRVEGGRALLLCQLFRVPSYMWRVHSSVCSNATYYFGAWYNDRLFLCSVYIVYRATMSLLLCTAVVPNNTEQQMRIVMMFGVVVLVSSRQNNLQLSQFHDSHKHTTSCISIIYL